MRKGFCLCMVVIWYLSLSGCGNREAVIAKDKWDCTVHCAEESGENSYIITYRDEPLLADTGCITFQNRNAFAITVHLSGKGKEVFVSEIAPGGNVAFLQVDPEVSYTVGIHADVEEGTELNVMAYNGDWSEIYEIDQEEFPDWGLALSAHKVSVSGLTLVCTQSGGNLTGELETGSEYKLLVLKDGIWQDVPTVIETYAWTGIGYVVPKNDSVKYEIDWEWLYGKLPAGNYRITKEFWDFRETGDYDTFNYWADFEIK